jgi:hypothetical protein
VPLTGVPPAARRSSYSLRITVPQDSRFTISPRPEEQPERKITEASGLRSHFWHFLVRPNAAFPEKVLLKPQATLLVVGDKTSPTSAPEDLASNEIEIFLYRKPSEPSRALTWILAVGASLGSGLGVFAVTNRVSVRKERRVAVEQLIHELEFDLGLVTKNNPASASILWDSAGRNLTFLAQPLRAQINAVYERVSSANRLGESMDKEPSGSTTAQADEIRRLFAELREQIPALLTNLRKNRPARAS